jgi:H+/Cl- antiporter ClcA
MDGDLFAADEINTLLERLDAQRLSAVERVSRTWELRTWPPLVFLLALLLSAEWLARRMKGRDEGGGMRDEKMPIQVE